ncbi:MAG: ATP-binding protein [Pseudomonadota bacterium]
MNNHQISGDLSLHLARLARFNNTAMVAICLCVALAPWLPLLALGAAGLICGGQLFLAKRPMRRASATVQKITPPFKGKLLEPQHLASAVWKRQGSPEALADRLRTLEAALGRSEDLRHEQMTFAYALSHDLKSPVNTIHFLLSELGTAIEEANEGDVQDLLQHAQEAAQRMDALIEATLEHAWAGYGSSAVESVDMAGCVQEVLADLRSGIASSGAEVHLGQLDPIDGHEVQIRVLLQNLISNALKFQLPGNAPRVSISCVNSGSDEPAILRVSDNGIGISPKDQEKIFGAFKRLHLQTTYPGSGLGLATCQRIARNHGGEIQVTSTPGKGSTFVIELNARTVVQEKKLQGRAA